MSFVLDISTPPLYGPGTLPLVTIDFLPTDHSTRWCLWRAEFGVFAGNFGVVYVIRCDHDDSAALENALAAEVSWGTTGLDSPVGSSRPSRACWVDDPTKDEEDELHLGRDGERYDLSCAALHEALVRVDLDYEASLALALAILRKGIEDSGKGFVEIDRNRVTVGPFEIALPPGVGRAYHGYDVDALYRLAKEPAWSALVPYLISAGIEFWSVGGGVDKYHRVFILADERCCSGPALTEKGE